MQLLWVLTVLWILVLSLAVLRLYTRPPALPLTEGEIAVLTGFLDELAVLSEEGAGGDRRRPKGEVDAVQV